MVIDLQNDMDGVDDRTHDVTNSLREMLMARMDDLQRNIDELNVTATQQEMANEQK